MMYAVNVLYINSYVDQSNPIHTLAWTQKLVSVPMH